MRLELPRGANVGVDVFDIVGRHIRALADGVAALGLQEWNWDGADAAGRHMPAGIHRVCALVDGVSQSRTIVRLN